VRLGAHQHPIGRLFDLRGIGECGQRQFDRPGWRVEHQFFERPAHASQHAMPAGGSKAAGHHAADAAKSDDRDGVLPLHGCRW